VVGVYITNTQRGYPANEAGMRSGDVITRFDGAPLQTPYELFAEILKHDVGDTVILEVYRDGEFLEFELELVEAPYTEGSGQE
jgi:S1-C subfamily serine protease